MKLLLISKDYLHVSYCKKLEILGLKPDIDLTVLIPEKWGNKEPEIREGKNFFLLPYPIHFSGHFHLYFWKNLKKIIRQVNPDIIHVEEEPYNPACFQVLHLANTLLQPTNTGKLKSSFFSWQTIFKNYPPPFSWFERKNYQYADCAIAGTEAAADVLRRRGFRKEIFVFPQSGIDVKFFNQTYQQPATSNQQPVDIGFLGRLVPEKGIFDLLHACSKLNFNWQLRYVGLGTESVKKKLLRMVHDLNCQDQVEIQPAVDSLSVPDFLRSLDVLVLSSKTTKSWQEQFGRVLIEAMACGVPVVGSSSGEIPNTIGGAGLIFDEGNIGDLREKIELLKNNADLRSQLIKKGLKRVQENFTAEIIAEKTYQVYQWVTKSKKQKIN